jgi:hypothetical protein
VLDQRGQLLRAALGFAGLPRPSLDRSLHVVRVRRVAVGMAHQGFDLQLTRYDERGWRVTVYTSGMEHSPSSAETADGTHAMSRDVAGGVEPATC